MHGDIARRTRLQEPAERGAGGHAGMGHHARQLHAQCLHVRDMQVRGLAVEVPVEVGVEAEPRAAYRRECRSRKIEAVAGVLCREHREHAIEQRIVLAEREHVADRRGKARAAIVAQRPEQRIGARACALEGIPRDVVAPGAAHQPQHRQLRVARRDGTARQVVPSLARARFMAQQRFVHEAASRLVQVQEHEAGRQDHPS